jgi:hypothetical protein
MKSHVIGGVRASRTPNGSLKARGAGLKEAALFKVDRRAPDSGAQWFETDVKSGGPNG